MRIVRAVFGVATLGLLVLGAGSCQKTEAKTTEIKVDNMICDMCVGTIETALNRVDGVKGVKVNKDAKIVTVRYDAGRVDVKGLEKAVSMSGYNANGTPADPKTHAALPECCRI